MYVRFLNFLIRHPLEVILIIAAIFFGTYKWFRSEVTIGPFFSWSYQQMLYVSIGMPPGTPLEETDKVMKKFEEKVMEKSYEKEGFQTPSGKVEIASSVLAEHGIDPLPVYREPPESPLSRPDLAGRYPLVLTSGARVMAYTHSQFRNIGQLRQLMPEPLADINPADAAPRGINTGDTIKISSPRGTIIVKAKVTDTILTGVVSVPHHWPDEANVNALVDDKNLDPISGFLPCKSLLCQVAKD